MVAMQWHGRRAWDASKLPCSRVLTVVAKPVLLDTLEGLDVAQTICPAPLNAGCDAIVAIDGETKCKSLMDPGVVNARAWALRAPLSAGESAFHIRPNSLCFYGCG